MGFINKPIGWIIKLCYQLIPNYAVALLLFAFIMKVLLFPFGIKQQKNMVRQAKLRPKEQAIRKRYAGRDDQVTKQKMQQDLMKLYQEENYNPASGCLPMILQLVIMFSLYGVINAPLTYVTGLSKGEISELGVHAVELYKEDKLDKEDLSESMIEALDKQVAKITENEDGTLNYEDVSNPASTQVALIRLVRQNYDAFDEAGYLPSGASLDTLPNFSIFGGKLDLSRNASFTSGDLLVLIPILTFVFTFGSMKLTRKLSYQPATAATGDAATSMKMMDFVMPLMSAFFTFSVPAVIAVYWIYQNILSTLQQFILKLMYPYPTFTEEDYKAAEREMNRGIKQPKKAKKAAKRAAHRIDLDDEAVEEAPAIEAPTGKPSAMIPPAALKDESDKAKDNE